MRFEIGFERVYPHPPQKVWDALTDPAALGEWLMRTDFVAEQGRDFTMWCDDGEGGTDTYRCRVLELRPPARMVWSWVLEGHEVEGATRVAFRLEPVADGTRLTISHSGDRDPDTIERFRGGWPVKLDGLEDVLGPAQGR